MREAAVATRTTNVVGFATGVAKEQLMQRGTTKSENPPEWARELRVAFDSQASGQFVIHGNVGDRMPVRSQLVNIEHYVRDELLQDFEVIFTYDLGNGLAVVRGGELLADWVPSALRSLPQAPLESFRFVSKYLRYLANVAALG